MTSNKISLGKKKNKTTSKSKLKAKIKKTKGDTKTQKRKKSQSESIDDTAIVIVDDELTVDKEKEIEERRAYLEEARSQDASD